MEQYVHSELTGRIIGCAMEVHRQLGSGFMENIYARALRIEMTQQGLAFDPEHDMLIFYKGEVIGKRRVDFFVESAVMVEIKALAKLEDLHLAQAINYLEASHSEIGLLLNFGGKSLDFKRVINRVKKNSL